MAKILEHNPVQELLSKQGIAPLEAMAWTKQNAQSIRISLPKESDPNENRISLSPQAVALLTNNGHEIVIEKGAGERAGFSDSDYLLAGASVSEDVAMIWQSALTLKITPPTIAEIARMTGSAEDRAGWIMDKLAKKELKSNAEMRDAIAGILKTHIICCITHKRHISHQ